MPKDQQINVILNKYVTHKHPKILSGGVAMRWTAGVIATCLFFLAACGESRPSSPTATTPDPGALVSREQPWSPPPVADPYPIRLHWALCPIKYADCTPVDDPRARFDSLMVDGAEYAAERWSQVLHPTPREPWVAPLEGWTNYGRRGHTGNSPAELWGVTPGEEIPAGLDVLVTVIADQEGCGWTCATGSPVAPPGGHLDIVRMAHLGVDSRMLNQDWTSLHELGHSIAMSGVGKSDWMDHIVRIPLNSAAQSEYNKPHVYVQTHPAIVEIYREHGGGAWQWVGKDLGVAMDPDGLNHWNDCAAPQDVMGPLYFHPTSNRLIRVKTAISPLTATAATVHGGFSVDMDQLRPADYHIPHYWNDQANRVCGVMQVP